MNDPFRVLNLPEDADDGAIRARYLELVRQFTPESAPQKFAAIRAAYDDLKDLETRVAKRLFRTEDSVNFHSLIEELECTTARPRPSLATLIEIARPR